MKTANYLPYFSKHVGPVQIDISLIWRDHIFFRFLFALCLFSASFPVKNNNVEAVFEGLDSVLGAGSTWYMYTIHRKNKETDIMQSLDVISGGNVSHFE